MTDTRQRLTDRFSWFVTSHRTAVLTLTVVVALAFSYGITRLKGEVLLEEMLPYDHPYLKIMARFFSVFGSGGSGVAIAVTATDGDIFKEPILAKIQQIDKTVASWRETYRVLTVSIGSRSVKVVKPLGDGEIKVLPLMWPHTPKRPEDIAWLRRDIYSDPIIRGVLASRDGSAALVLTEFKEYISYEHAFALLQTLVRDYSDQDTTIHIVGFPMLMGWVYSYRIQIATVMAVSVILMILILFLIFRNLTGMAAPMIFALISTAMGLGFIGWTGLNFSPLMYVLAFLVAARMVSHAVQVTCRYIEQLAAGSDRITACYHTIRTMIRPNWAGVTTDAAGFLILIVIKIVLMQQVAIFMTFWMLSVALCSIVTPILCSIMPLAGTHGGWSQDRNHLGLLDKICVGTTRFSIGPGRYAVLALVAVVFILCAWPATRLKIGDASPGSPLLWPDHRYNQDQALVDRTFDASSENLVLYFEGEEEAVYDPAVFNTFEAFDRHMKRALPDIYKSSNAFMGLMKSVNMIMHDGDMVWRQLPHQADIMSGLVGLTKSHIDVYTQRRYFNDKMSMAQITLFFSDHTSENLLRIRNAADAFFEIHPISIEKGAFKLAGGRIGMEIAINEEMKRTHAVIDTLVLGTIFILCAVFFRSLIAGLMLTLPLILGNMVAFAYMALTNIGLSINTLPVAAVGVGVGVDFAIYIYNRCMEEFPLGDGWEDSILASIRTSGKAVVFTGLTMILPIMVWYFISDLKFQAQMGIFLAIILATNVMLSITLHPLMIYLIKPRFISREASRVAVRDAPAMGHRKEWQK